MIKCNMKILAKIFKKEKPTVPAWWVGALLLLAVFGLVDSFYLLVKQFSHQDVVCNLYALNGCETVLNSEYAKLFGVNLSVWGFLYYLAVFVLALIFAATAKKRYFNLLFALSAFGFLFSVRLVYLQAAVLENMCFYCLLSALFSTLIFITNGVYYISGGGRDKSDL